MKTIPANIGKVDCSIRNYEQQFGKAATALISSSTKNMNTKVF